MIAYVKSVWKYWTQPWEEAFAEKHGFPLDLVHLAADKARRTHGVGLFKSYPEPFTQAVLQADAHMFSASMPLRNMDDLRLLHLEDNVYVIYRMRLGMTVFSAQQRLATDPYHETT